MSFVLIEISFKLKGTSRPRDHNYVVHSLKEGNETGCKG